LFGMGSPRSAKTFPLLFSERHNLSDLRCVRPAAASTIRLTCAQQMSVAS
jgi:hypothetical protein